MKYIMILILLIFNCCKGNDDKQAAKSKNIQIENNIEHTNIKKYTINIIDTIPHNVNYYTQGLIFHNETLYEGTGLEGKSLLLKYNKHILHNKTNIAKQINLNPNIFGEGITILNEKIYQITWLNQICVVYALNSLEKTNELTYSGEGWGLTNNDSMLIMSDGSANIKFINPINFTTTKNMLITNNGTPVRYLNELELIDTMLYANVYMKDIIVIANINTGKIVGEIDISSLRKHLHNNPEQEVSNGIAFDKKNNVFYITGKYWNKIFIVKLVEKVL